MFVKKFQARSLEKALALVKAELGPDALVISTQKLKKGFLQKSMVEVTAAFEKSKPGEKKEAPKESLEDIFPHRKQAPSDSKVEANTYSNSIAKKINPKQVSESELGRFHRFEDTFLSCGFEPDTATELTRRLLFDYSSHDLEVPSFLEKAKTAIMRGSIKMFSLEAFCQKSNWIVIGAPGVGKTSTCVKLTMALQRRKQPVALVGLDRRKVLGSSELAAYAKLLRVSFETKLNVHDDRAAIQIVDGLPNADGADSLGHGTGVLLVLDATARLPQLIQAVQSAKPRLPDAICFTKTDISLQRGVLFEVARRTKVPLLGVSVSQSFKKSIQFFNSKEFVRFILEKDR